MAELVLAPAAELDEFVEDARRVVEASKRPT